MRLLFTIVLMSIMFNFGFSHSKFNTIPDSIIVINGDTLRIFEMPQITILSGQERELVRLPGSYQILNSKDLRNQNPLTTNEIFRKISGIHAVEEEGVGLRMNIGIRGLDPDRSRNVLLLEDGIPLALNPYGEPEAYFSPSIDKMSAIEVLKGSGQILYGPQTTGGVINFLTMDPPENRMTKIRLRAGTGKYSSLFASHGETIKNVGYNVNVLHKRGSHIGQTAFNLTDISTKIKIQLNSKSSLGLKLGFYDEYSNSTYIGLTQTMYDRGGQDFVHMAPDDELPVRRLSTSMTHIYKPNDNISLHTTGFGYTTSRNWRRQDFSSNPNANNQTGTIWGDPNIPGGAIYMLNSTGNRNRQFEVAGLESRLRIENELFGKQNQLEIGSRYMFERAYEQFIIGAKTDASAGNMRDNEIRTGHAIAFFVQDRWKVLKDLTISAGLRIESFDFERHILRGRFLIDGSNQTRDTSVIGSQHTFVFIPGVGFNYKTNKYIDLFGGLHRGYAPPRVKDAITSDGSALNLDAELSHNYELGMRWYNFEGFKGQLTGFFMNFSNQIIPISESSGNVNATGLANGGATRHLGIESSLGIAFQELFQMKAIIELELSATFVQSKYSKDRFVGQEQINIIGNKLPYAPASTYWAGINFEWRGAGFQFSANYIDGQYSDELNTINPSPNGRSGWIPSRTIADAGMYYRLAKYNTTFRFNVKNIGNERYIASRRPQGIRVGLPRFITAGVDLTF
jgi:Fe(3+) dicitrate transport protein